MGKGKLQKFAEMQTFTNVFQPHVDFLMQSDFELKGKWAEKVFNNNNSIVAEFGCGKGEYTVNLAQAFPNKNFIGVDIKGARIWKGAKFAFENKILNAAFLRTRLEFISSCFAKDEISELWITFPDPQLKKQRAKKRLTYSGFLNKYSHFLKPDGIIHLKTDSKELHDYTLRVIHHNGLEIIQCTDDLYNSPILNSELSIKTFYEGMFLSVGKPITYLSFRLNNKVCTEPPDEEE